MKDALGHGSDARGGGSYDNIDKNARGPGKHTGYANGPWQIQKSNGPNSNWYQAVHQQTGNVITGKGLGAISARLASLAAAASAHSIAQQHGISTEHLNPAEYNSSGHKYGSPEALSDFKRQYGGPRDHAAEQRGFNSGRREISRLQKQGK